MDGAIFNPLIPLEYVVLLGLTVITVSGTLAWRAAARCARPKRVLLAALRGSAMLLLALLAANPGGWRRADSGTRHEAVVLVDRSASMAVADADGGRSRWKAAADLAEVIQTQGDEALSVVIRPFAAALEDSVARVERLVPDGEASDILGAGRTVLERSRGSGRRLMGVLLLSDGRQTGARAAALLGDRARAMDCPVSAVVFGSEVAEPDLSVRVDRRQHIALPGQKLTVACTVGNARLPGISPRVRLLDGQGAEAGAVQPQFAEAGAHVVRMDVPPLAPGYHTFQIAVPAWEGERRTDNNTAAFAVLVPERKMRLFVAEGTPSWDTKFFLQLLRRLPFVSVRSVSRVTSDRYFEVRDDSDQFQNSSEAIFPDTREALAEYDALLIGKGAEYFLTPARAERLQAFVRDQGGSLLFFRGRPTRTPLPEVEALEPVRWGAEVSGAAHLRPTRAAETLGLFGDALPGAGDALWLSLPPIRGTRSVAEPKAFATVLMTAGGESAAEAGGEPILVSRRFGKGLVLALNADGLWQWDFFPVTENAQAIYATLWAQLLQWAVSSSDFLPGQSWSLRLSETAVSAGQPVHATVTRRTGEAPDLAVSLRVFHGDRVVQAQQVQALPGILPTAVATVLLHEPGDYRVELFAADGQTALGPCRTLSVRATPGEQTTYSADPGFAAELARLSGGAVLTPAEAGRWVAELRRRSEATGLEQAHRTYWRPMWDVWQVLAAVAALLCAEWFIRKRSGLL